MARTGAAGEAEPLHRLTARDLESLARGGGEASALAELVRAEHSHRLLLLDVLLDTLARLDGVAGPLPAPGRAWDLLAAAQRWAPEAVRELLNLPETGLWAGQLLDRLHHPRPHDLPLWADVGHLHCLAAVAASRAGLDFSFPLPCVGGRVELPALGQVRLPARTAQETAVLAARAGAVTVTSPGGTVRVPDEPARPGPGWLPLRHVNLGLPGGEPFRLLLDDLGRHRVAARPAGAARRLGPETATRLIRLVQEGAELLAEADPVSAVTVAALLRTIQPMAAHEAFRVRSASSSYGVGGLALSLPESPSACAAALVHELQHSKLNALSHLFPLVEEGPGPGRLYYAPWRDDPRPLNGMLQGIYAFTGVARFWSGRTRLPGGAHDQLAWFEFALWRGQLVRALSQVGTDPELTRTGVRLVEEVHTAVAGWADDVPGGEPAREAVQLAGRLAADHRVLWRLHHVRPFPDDIEALAAAWLTGAAPLLPARRQEVTAERRQHHLDSRAVLARMALLDPASLDKLRDAVDDDGVPGVTGADPADVAWATGDPVAAEHAYQRTLLAASAPPAAWAGLRLTLDETGRNPSALRALTAVPEVVRAVARQLRGRTGQTADPVGLAQWLGRALAEDATSGEDRAGL
ncbi:HEXXH motif domain-containing protein [Streptomyces sp. NPDC059786]|uniref:HEXXH motif domain-containing protein n=1 Tax=Streptomyces sp. NPDC059786 TaxID=3346946 RepID=UPI00365D693C